MVPLPTSKIGSLAEDCTHDLEFEGLPCFSCTTRPLKELDAFFTLPYLVGRPPDIVGRAGLAPTLAAL
jgi:hypothetical protein